MVALFDIRLGIGERLTTNRRSTDVAGVADVEA